MMECIESSTVTARKAHTCTWCREPIEAGTTYHRFKWVEAREMWTQKAHEECLDLLNRYGAYWAIETDEPVCWDEVLEWAAQEPTP